ncbi:MAG: hypothetical protein IID08_09490 [Candidatus Hydrogenedentes bacterium]|nr:hypothetical protein [Candidatus Hydrogenedentota bacterium]
MSRNIKVLVFIVFVCAIFSTAIVYKNYDEYVVLVGPDSVQQSRDDSEGLEILRVPHRKTSTREKVAARKRPSAVVEKDPMRKIEDSLRFNRDPFSTMADERANLIDMLNDEEYVADWRYISRYIGYAGESDLATSAIIEYATRDEDIDLLSILRPIDLYSLLLNKACSIYYLGLTRGEKANEYLRKSISAEGAAEITEKWIHIPESLSNEIDKELVNRSVRASAALGLVLTQDPENIRIVQDLHTKINSYLRTEAGSELAPSARHRPHGEEHRSAESLHGLLVDVLAANDLVQDVGIDMYKLISLQPEGRLQLIGEYGKKYSFDYWNYE